MKQIRNTITKAEIATMPKVLFEGRIFVIYTEADADKAVEYLKTQHIVGVDTSQSLLKFTSIELVMPSNHLILCRVLTSFERYSFIENRLHGSKP